MNTPSMRPPQPDATLIAAALNALFESDDVIELRALLSKQRRRTDVGYFDGKHREQLIQEAVRLNNAGAAVYVTLNRLDPQLLARCANRVQQGAQTSAADADVTRRRWLLLDFDPIRPKDTSSTGEQLKAAKDCARACYQALKAEGWPEPVVAESGNGMHLLYPLDMPSDNESRDLIKGTLAGLAQRFDTERVTLDRTVFNAGRIIKLYGTVANKGDHTLTAPWRLSRLESTPVRGPVVTVDQLRALHPVIDTSSTATRVGAFPRLDLEEFLSRLGIAYTHDMHEGSERFKLDHCPFNADHGKGEAAIFRSADGVFGFKCQHNSCAEYHWQDVRALVDGPREARTKLLAPAPSLSSALPNQAHRGNSRCRADEESWPQPQPLIIAADMAPYPLHALPEGIREAVREVVGFVQCPVSLAACSALSALSLTCQALADVRRADKLAGPCSLYLLAVAESGERKTTCDSLFALSIREWEQEQTGRMQPELSRHTAALNAWTAKYQGVSQAIKHAATSSKLTFDKEGELERLEADKPQAPRVPSLIYGDTTPEALAFNLTQEWPSGGVLSSEAGIVFGGHGMGRDSIMRNLALLNSLWDGIRHKVHRRTSDSFTVQDVRLTMGLAVQPDTVRTFFENSKGLARGSGFAARFLIAWPESTQGERLFKSAPKSWPHLSGFHRRIRALLDQTPSINAYGELELPILDLSQEATAAWIHFHDEVERELRPGGDMADTRDVASKAADNAARLAALFHIHEYGPSGEISAAHIHAASRIVTWHLYEAQRFLSGLVLPPTVINAAKLDAWLLHHCGETGASNITTRHAQQYGPLRDKQRLDDAIAGLIDAGRVRLSSEGRQRLIDINPVLMRGAD